MGAGVLHAPASAPRRAPASRPLMLLAADRKRHVRRCSNGLIRCTSTSTSTGGQREQRGGGGDGCAAGRISHLTAPNVPRPQSRTPKLQPAAAVRLLTSVCSNWQASARGARAGGRWEWLGRRRHEGAGAAFEEGAQEGWGWSSPKRGAVEASSRAGELPRSPPPMVRDDRGAPPWWGPRRLV